MAIAVALTGRLALDPTLQCLAGWALSDRLVALGQFRPADDTGSDDNNPSNAIVEQWNCALFDLTNSPVNHA